MPDFGWSLARLDALQLHRGWSVFISSVWFFCFLQLMFTVSSTILHIFQTKAYRSIWPRSVSSMATAEQLTLAVVVVAGFVIKMKCGADVVRWKMFDPCELGQLGPALLCWCLVILWPWVKGFFVLRFHYCRGKFFSYSILHHTLRIISFGKAILIRGRNVVALVDDYSLFSEPRYYIEWREEDILGEGTRPYVRCSSRFKTLFIVNGF